jgi:hypothetical protein
MCNLFDCKLLGPECAVCIEYNCPDYGNCMICRFRNQCEIFKENNR